MTARNAKFDLHFSTFLYARTLEELGFYQEYTGGNLRAWRMDVDQSLYVLLSYDDGEAFGDPDATRWLWGAYHHDRPHNAGGTGLNLEAAALWAKAFILRVKMDERGTVVPSVEDDGVADPRCEWCGVFGCEGECEDDGRWDPTQDPQRLADFFESKP